MEADPLGIPLILFLLLLLLYSLLTAAETAARTLNKNKLRRQAEYEVAQSDLLLTFAQKLTETPSGLRACLAFVGFFAAGLAATVWGQLLSASLVRLMPVLEDRGGDYLSLLLIMVGTSFLFLLFGTLLPRRLAVRDPEKTAKRLHGLANFFHHLFQPLASFSNTLSLGLMRLLGISAVEEIEQLTEDEIRLLVDVGEEKGAIQETEREMIENVFEFNNLTAADSMTHRTDVWAIWVDDTWEEIVKLIESTGLSRFPVYEDDLDHIIGTVSTRDFLLNANREHPKPLRDLLRKARFVPESVRTDALFRDMQHNKYHMAIVVDEYGGTSGLITMEDLLEEIVGNIYDEYDPQAQLELEDLGSGRFKAAGSMDIEVLNDSLGLDLPIDQEYDTVGGMILSQLGTIPEDGAQPQVAVDGATFQVLSMADRRIEWVEITLPAKEEAQEDA